MVRPCNMSAHLIEGVVEHGAKLRPRFGRRERLGEAVRNGDPATGLGRRHSRCSSGSRLRQWRRAGVLEAQCVAEAVLPPASRHSVVGEAEIHNLGWAVQ